MRPPPPRNFNGTIPRIYNPHFGSLRRACHGQVPSVPTSVSHTSQLYQSCQRPPDRNMRPLREINHGRLLPVGFLRSAPNPKLPPPPPKLYKPLVLHTYS
jgi:hypothetical protein